MVRRLRHLDAMRPSKRPRPSRQGVGAVYTPRSCLTAASRVVTAILRVYGAATVLALLDIAIIFAALGATVVGLYYLCTWISEHELVVPAWYVVGVLCVVGGLVLGR